MSLWDTLTGWLSKDAQVRANVDIRPDHVDRPFTPVPIEADRHYFRISVAQMYLQKRSQLFQTWYPAVHSLVLCSFAGQSVELPNVADPTKWLQQDDKGDWIAKNFTLLSLMPFKGGEVRVVAGLYAVPGENQLTNFIGVLGGFAKLLAVPQLSTALTIAQPLATGIQTLFGAGGGMHLGYQNTFVGAGGQAANVLQEGYIALLRQNASDSWKNTLFVVNDELREGTGLGDEQNQPYQRSDFMLLRVELRETRDDFNDLASIAAPRKAALEAIVSGDTAKADAQHRQSVLAAYLAPELTGPDRRRVIDLLKREFEEAKDNFREKGLVPGREVDFQTRMNKGAMSVSKARHLGEPVWAELFSK